MTPETQPGRRERQPEGARHSPAGAGVVALFVLALLSGAWTWWALQSGAYFGTVFYPGVVLLALGFVVLRVVVAPWRASLRLSAPARIAVLALIGLAGWTLCSALWSPSPDIALLDAQRALGYALAVALGAWLCALLGRRMELAAVPLAVAAAIAGIVTALRLLGAGDVDALLELDGTLDYPLGYRNANAAFFLIALWPCLALAVSKARRPAVRVPALATASLCIGVALLSQSRGAVVALVVGFLVYLLAAPRRVPALLWAGVALAPALIEISAASTLYSVFNEGGDVQGAARDAGRSLLIVVGLALTAGALAVGVERRVPAPKRPHRLRGRGARAAAVVLVVVAVAGGMIAVVGNPVSWVGDRLDEFRSGGQPDLSAETSRFTANAASNRSDLWRVALNAAEDDPLLGDGAGGFQYRYLRERESVDQLARDAHNVSLEMLTELGVVGLVLFVAVIVGLFAGAVRARRLEPGAANLACGALAAGGYWFAHASLDWFWPYPGVTAPVLALLGAASIPMLATASDRSRARRFRNAPALAAVVLALSVVPPLLSEQYVKRAGSTFEVDRDQAYEDLDAARALNPLSDVPTLVEGRIAQVSGDRDRAIQAFREAMRERPEEWASHYFLALVYARDEPRLARDELSAIAELNPLAPELEEVRGKIAAARRRE